jgi:two-component system, NarL family, response regulator
VSNHPIRVLCVDDHRLVLEGLTLIISRYQDMTVVGTATTGEEAVALYRLHQPDVTLMDLQLPVMTGLEAIRVIHREYPNGRIIVLTTYNGDEDIFRALQAGASTYLLKDMISDDLVRVIREVHEGTHQLEADLQFRLTERASRPVLTPREVQVIDLVAQGMRNKEVGAALGISEDTAQVHMKNILSKLGVNDRTAAVKIAMQRGIIHLSS